LANLKNGKKEILKNGKKEIVLKQLADKLNLFSDIETECNYANRPPTAQ